MAVKKNLGVIDGNSQGKCVSAPPGHEVHPQPKQESILGHFSQSGLDLEVYLDRQFRATTKKRRQLFLTKNAHPDKILIAPERLDLCRFKRIV